MAATTSTYKRLKPAEYAAGDGLRRYLFSLMYQSRYMKEHLGDRNKATVAFAIINSWCNNRGEFKKPLNSHTKAELGKLKPIFQKVVTDSWEALRELDIS